MLSGTLPGPYGLIVNCLVDNAVVATAICIQKQG